MKNNLIIKGRNIIEYRDQLIDEVVEHIHIVRYNEYCIGMINNGIISLTSDIGNKVMEKNEELSFVIVYYIDTEKEEVGLSLRGMDRRNINCAKIAKLWNGGGHANASGGKVGIDEFNSMLFLRKLDSLHP